jgi:hypothetical protein
MVYNQVWSSLGTKDPVNSLPLLGFELMIFWMLAHLSSHSAKSHPQQGFTFNA